MNQSEGNQWAFLFLQDRCTGCGTCVMACRAWNHDRRGDRALSSPNRIGTVPPNLADPDDCNGTMRESWRRVTTREEGSDPQNLRLSHMTSSCQHCDDPACAAACPVKRIWKEPEFGAVVIRGEIACISCGLCKKRCPWDAPQFWKAPGRRKDGLPPAEMTKCDLCYGRIREGLKPACVAACPTRALFAGPEKELLARYPDAVRVSPGMIAGLEAGPGMPYGRKPSLETGLPLPHFWAVLRFREN